MLCYAILYNAMLYYAMLYSFSTSRVAKSKAGADMQNPISPPSADTLYLYLSPSLSLSLSIYIYTHSCIVYTLCMYVCMCIYIYIYIHNYVCVYIYIYTYMCGQMGSILMGSLQKYIMTFVRLGEKIRTIDRC